MPKSDPARPGADVAVTVARLGADGDGIAEGVDGATLYLPRTLPGERVLARPVAHRGGGWLAEAAEILAPSPERAAPPCPHFDRCGGCALQHWQEAPYRAWKAGLLQAALARAGYDEITIAPPAAAAPASRRRFDFAFGREGGVFRLGLHATHSRALVDIGACPVLHPALAALLAPLRAVLATLPPQKGEGRVAANLLQDGADLLIESRTEPGTAARARLIAFARAHGIARISWSDGRAGPEALCRLAPTRLSLAGATVEVPSGAFLQATRESEQAIMSTVLAGLPERLRPRDTVIELYSGCGTLSFPLAARARVRAFEGSPEQVSALSAAAGAAGLGGKLTATCRDLARQPLAASELAGAAGVVLDPPYDGAARQTEALAAAKPPRIIYVSCNPAALARDGAALNAAGYRLLAATAVDQFLWSARLEAVAVFTRA